MPYGHSSHLAYDEALAASFFEAYGAYAIVGVRTPTFGFGTCQPESAFQTVAQPLETVRP
jgi:hypothetical protein